MTFEPYINRINMNSALNLQMPAFDNYNFQSYYPNLPFIPIGSNQNYGFLPFYMQNNQNNYGLSFLQPNITYQYPQNNWLNINQFQNYNTMNWFNNKNFGFNNTQNIFTSNIKTNPVREKTETPKPQTATKETSTGVHDLAWWKSQGYDEEMGKKLAKDAVSHWKNDPGQCGKYTRETLNRLYGTNIKNAGAAIDFGRNKIMTDPTLNKKWKKVDVKGLKDSEIPDGAIVLWAPGTPGYTKGKAALYGHIAIANNGDGYSNKPVKNLSTYAEIWIPVKA